MSYNPGSRAVYYVKDDTHVAASAVDPEHADQIGSVRLLLGTGVEVYMTPKAAAAIVQQVAAHVPSVFAVITGPPPDDIILASDGTKYAVQHGTERPL